MKLTRFSLTKDNIGIERNGKQFDLHNCFSFVSMFYDIVNRELSLRWIKAVGDHVPSNLPDELLFEFTGISLFKARARDTSRPFEDDEYLNVIGFVANDSLCDIGGNYSHEATETCNHLCLEFKSGFAIKFGAETATLTEKSNF
jgi:hypothetical protein